MSATSLHWSKHRHHLAFYPTRPQGLLSPQVKTSSTEGHSLPMALFPPLKTPTSERSTIAGRCSHWQRTLGVLQPVRRKALRLQWDMFGVPLVSFSFLVLSRKDGANDWGCFSVQYVIKGGTMQDRYPYWASKYSSALAAVCIFPTCHPSVLVDS